MIRVSQIKVKIEKINTKKGQEEAELTREVAKILKIAAERIMELTIIKRSIDARKKPDIKYIYTVDVKVDGEAKLVKKLHNPNVTISKKQLYHFVPTGVEPLKERPIIIGTGPAGLFCGYMLALHGYMPLVLERGKDVKTRIQDVNRFWTTNELLENSNVQFGEGGAGTFSDGKLNTMVKDESGRNKKVLEIFVEHGADSEILYKNKPHIGTDHLIRIVKSMRERIIELGGEVRFGAQVTDFMIEQGRIQKVIVNQTEEIKSDLVVLAVGHSARDTFEMLYRKGVEMKQKPFAIGVRIEHPQSIIDHAQYGECCMKLPAADYKLTHQTQAKRSIYSFCMCPGGFVVNASSEKGHLVVNGMSNSGRDEKNANSAMIVGVTPEDFLEDSPLAGIQFQRKWERLAYETGQGKVPVQLFGDLCQNKLSTSFGGITPNLKGMHTFGKLTDCLPSYVTDTIIEGVRYFDSKIPGFGSEEAILSGVETRTSSPIRIHRDEAFTSNIKNLYPCGEGAGYAGGITSAAMDGIKVFEAIATAYKVSKS